MIINYEKYLTSSEALTLLGKKQNKSAMHQSGMKEVIKDVKTTMVKGHKYYRQKDIFKIITIENKKQNKMINVQRMILLVLSETITEKDIFKKLGFPSVKRLVYFLEARKKNKDTDNVLVDFRKHFPAAYNEYMKKYVI